MLECGRRRELYQEVCDTYEAYILSRYNSVVTVVFDGYAGPISTKSAEQKRRAKRGTFADIAIARCLPTTASQMRLIKALTPVLQNAGIVVKQAVSDADTLIVETALHRATSSQVAVVVVVETDTDILVVLIARATSCMHIICCAVGMSWNCITSKSSNMNWRK